MALKPEKFARLRIKRTSKLRTLLPLTIISLHGKVRYLAFVVAKNDKSRLYELLFSNFSCMFLNPDNFFQFEF
jgi:hypothetical protein